MEKHTMGGFIAALRKANGLTQRELAEQLNVSDKAVSRWERDESAPDLTLIPVIAELFGVTADELLLGQRRPAAEATDTQPRRDKLLKRLLREGANRFYTRLWLCLGLEAAGLLAAMLANFAFNRAYLGFFLGCVCYLAAVVLALVFYTQAQNAVEEEDYPELDIRAYRRELLFKLLRPIVLALVLLGATMPLIALPGDPYLGLRIGSWLGYGALGGLAGGLLSLIALALRNRALLKRGWAGERDTRLNHNLRLQNRCAAWAMTLLAVTLMAVLIVNSMGLNRLCRGTTFTTFEDFREYIETPKEASYYGDSYYSQPAPEASAPEQVYYDQDGNEISREESLRDTLTDQDGNVLYEYYWRNREVSSIFWGFSDNDFLPVTVFTRYDFFRAQQTQRNITIALCVAYGLELAAIWIVYINKRQA